MKKILNTLYVLTDSYYLSLDGENVVVLDGDNEISRFPFHAFEAIVSFSFKGASPALMGACAKRNIRITFMSPYGKFLARISGNSYGNVLLRREQYRIADVEEKSCLYAKSMIYAKIYNCRWCLERTVRDHKARVDAEKIKKVSEELKKVAENIWDVNDLDELRGREGEAAVRYFSVFDELIINQKQDFTFLNRNKRPPLDRVNALLSLTYTVITIECANALESVGLDSYVGFMHTDRPGRESLALDLIEEFRGSIADRFVLTLINTNEITKRDFLVQENSAVRLTDDGRKKFYAAWQKRKKQIITHPFLKEKMEWGLVPYIQAQLMARTIRGDLEMYPPFLWK